MVTFTERLLRDAGVIEGMRVADLGCGRGDVTLLLASIVGSRGEVVGIDRDAAVLALARERITPGAPIRFVQGDFSTPAAEGPFDAAIGRRVLMYQPDPLAAMKRVVEGVRPGGLVVFQEHQASAQASDSFPVHARVQRWIWEMVAREGAHLDMGMTLAPIFEAAGLVVEDVRAEAVLQTRTTHSAFHAPLGFIVRAVAHRIVAAGVATEAELDLATLDARLLEERQHANGTFFGDFAFGVIARVPANVAPG